MALALVAGARHVVEQRAARGQLHIHVRDLRLDHLERADGLAELLPLERVPAPSTSNIYISLLVKVTKGVSYIIYWDGHNNTRYWTSTKYK